MLIRLIIAISIITSISLVCLPSVAENINFPLLDVNAGLPSNSVRAIVQDRQGYVWFGTELGLARYDGYSLKQYLSDKDKLNTIADPYVMALEVDDNNVLWVSSSKSGLARYNRDADDFTVFIHDKDNTNSLSSNTVTALQKQHKNIMWIATGAGLDRLDTTNNQFEHFIHDPHDPYSIPNRNIRSLLNSKNGDLWVGSDRGLAVFNPSNGHFERVELKKGKQPTIRTLTESNTGNIWVGTHEGLFEYNPQNLSVKKIQFNEKIKKVLSSTTDLNGNLWIGTSRNGLYRIEPENNIVNIRPDKTNATALKDVTVFSLFSGISGQIWLGTFDAGASYFNPENLRFGSYNNSKNSISCLPSTDIRSALALSNKHFLVGTILGLSEINLDEKKCKNFSFDPNDVNSLSSNEVYAIRKSEEDIFWIGSAGGFDRFDRSHGKFKRFGKQINNATVLDIIQHKDILILATDQGVFGFNKLTQKAFLLPSEDKNLSEPYAFGFSIDKDNAVWIASSHGLLILDEESKVIRQAKINNKPVIQEDITAISIDQNNLIWLSIENQGLAMFDPVSRIIKPIDKQLNLDVKNGFTGLHTDQSNNLWITTEARGIFKIDHSRSMLVNYNQSDGLHSELFNFGSFAEFSDGRLLFGGKSGFNLFDPLKIRTDESLPIVSLTQLKRYGKPVTPHQDYDGFKIDKHVSELKELHLSHRDTVFGLNFVATHYLDPESIQYAYKLQGFDADWITTNAQNRGVTYNNIDPGEYIFRVKAQTKNAVWSENDVELKIHITPAPWLTWWAFSLYTLLFVFSVFIFVKRRTYNLERRALQLQQTVEKRTCELSNEKKKVEELLSRKNEELANVSHEFRTPLSLILGPLAQVLKTNKNPNELNRLNIVQRNGYRLLRMVDQLLNLETFRIKSITQKSPQAIGKTIRLLSEAFLDLAKEKEIELTIGEIAEVNFEFTNDAIEKIVLNLLSNAIKYTKPGGTVCVESKRKTNDQLTIQIADSGIGIPKDKIGTVFERYNRVLDENSEQVTGAGIGLALVKNLVEAHQGHISIDSEINRGTTMTVCLPIIGEVDASQVNEHANNEIIAMELMSITSQSTAGSQERQLTDYQSESGAPSVLVIEDNEDMRNYIVDRIIGQYQVLTAKDGAEGIKLALTEVPDLIISDIMMPIKDGYQVTNELRHNHVTDHIPIILLTARGDRESRLKGWHKQADEYLTKPFDVEELRIRISNLLGIRDILKKRFAETAFQIKRPILHAGAFSQDDSCKIEDNRSKIQEKFIEQLNVAIEKHFTKASMSVATIASEVAMSERQFFRKLKGTLDLTPVEYIRRFRIEKGRILLKQGKSVTYVTFEIGFTSQSYFGKCFKAQYGLSPSDFKKNLD